MGFGVELDQAKALLSAGRIPEAIILLSRVVTRLGTLSDVHPGVIERLFSEDLAYLQDLYNQINGLGPRMVTLSCPHCAERSEVEVVLLEG